VQDFVKQLLALGCPVSSAAADDMNALHFAAQKGHAETVRHILNAGALPARNLPSTVHLRQLCKE